MKCKLFLFLFTISTFPLILPAREVKEIVEEIKKAQEELKKLKKELQESKQDSPSKEASEKKSSTSAAQDLTPVIPAKTSYKFTGGKYHIQFDDSWQLPEPGRGIVQFSIKAVDKNPLADVDVMFSENKSLDEDKGYKLVLGGEGNTATWIRRGKDGKGQNEVKKEQNPEAMLKAGTYWFRVYDGVISFGQSENIGENEVWRWQEPKKKIPNLTHFGFAEKALIEDIKIFAAPEEKTPYSLHKEFDKVKEPKLHTHHYQEDIQGEDETATFNEAWKLPEPNNGAITCTVQATNEVYVAFAEKMLGKKTYSEFNDEKEHAILLTWDAWKNEKTRISAHPNGGSTWIYNKENPNMKIKPNEPTEYWFMIKDGVFSFGFGTDIGKKKLYEWRPLKKINPVSYFGFGSGDYGAFFKDIKIYALKEAEKEEVKEKEETDELE
ncbi:MAG: hypothetical protein H6679_02275 [Epsilonproteobacteria bacterium]|nr:hypothetical protein [Campylobacterota bacterium]